MVKVIAVEVHFFPVFREQSPSGRSTTSLLRYVVTHHKLVIRKRVMIHKTDIL